MATLLLVTIALPFFGALLVGFFGSGQAMPRWVALAITLATAMLAIYLMASFDPASEPFAARRWLAVALGLLFLSGIPPLAGFWGKLTLLASAVQQARDSAIAPGWFLVLLIVAALNAAVAAGYYLRVVATMYFGSGQVQEVTPVTGSSKLMPRVTAVCCGLIVIAVGLFPGMLIEHAGHAGESVHSRKPADVLATPG